MTEILIEIFEKVRDEHFIISILIVAGMFWLVETTVSLFKSFVKYLKERKEMRPEPQTEAQKIQLKIWGVEWDIEVCEKKIENAPSYAISALDKKLLKLKDRKEKLAAQLTVAQTQTALI